MAIGKGKETTEAQVFSKYIGVASCFVLAVNPDKKKLEELYQTTLDKDPEYIIKKEGEQDSVRISFVVKTDEDKYPAMTTQVTFYLRNEGRFNKDKTKLQVIDKYGRTCWVGIEDAKNHVIPMYSNGPANIDADYRPCYSGEENLTNFIKTWLNLPNVMSYIDGKWVPNPDVAPEDCECRLDCIKDYFKGNFKELADIVNILPNNKVKILFGVKNTADNKQYQTCFIDRFLKPFVTNYDKLEEDVKSRKDASAYPDTEFRVIELEEYKLEPSKLNEKGEIKTEDSDDDLPWK